MERRQRPCATWLIGTLRHNSNSRFVKHAAQLHRDSLTYFPSYYEAGILEAYQALGEAKLGLGQMNEATSWLAQGIVLSQALDAPAQMAWCLAGLGSAAALDEEPERAARL